MKRLLLVFAHPDDESFSCGGTVAKYAAAGWHVDLICATHSDIQKKELQKAGVILSISTITFLGYQEGKLASQTPGELEDTVHKKMEELVPDAVITMDTTGINNDPDHVKMCFVTTYAFQKYAAWIEEQLKDQEEAAQNFPKLYYTSLPESVIDYVKKKKHVQTELFGKPLVGTEDKKITTVIDITEFADIKKQALASFVSQHENMVDPMADHEYFILRMQGMTEVFMGKNDYVSNNL
jgi:LmbE family N-acetylglucosaminyl deacetylase